MSNQVNAHNKNFELISTGSYEKLEGSERVASIALQIGRLSMNMCGVSRGPVVRYEGDVRGVITQGTVREDNAQHSFMLGMLSKELITDPLLGEYFDHLSELEAARFSDVHDIPEIVTSDKVTYSTTPEELVKKEDDEALATEFLVQFMPIGMAADLIEYNRQERPTARYVRHVDKLLPLVVDYLGVGADVLRYDYGVTSLDEHIENVKKNQARLKEMFPAEDRGHQVLHEAYAILATLSTHKLAESFNSKQYINQESA